ncbi:YceD family protein [Altericroceibacterium xinjiangense]|uniref:YceD family protein n=1 Tax=Altericroceibacterium xinjiangense TaxID=762261 RepID=UPI000F7DD622|nr:YceD family protein [Altericroceibacterium xinjiangense]
MSDSEFPRPIDRRRIDAKPLHLEANEGERAALAARFGLVAVNSLVADVALEPDEGAILASGRMQADIVQSCAISGEDLPVSIDEPLALRFVPARQVEEEEEIELEEGELDEMEFTGDRFDVGEAVAQSLALAIDPYATGPQAEDIRKQGHVIDEAAAGPFAALAALKKD